MDRRRLTHTCVLLVGSIALVASLLMGGVSAYAQSNDELADRVEQATQEYREAADEVERIEAEIAQNEEKSEDIQSRLPEQRERTAASIKNLYLFQQNSPGLLDLVLSAEDFNDFISTLRYIDTIHSHYTEEVTALVDMANELEQAQATLNADREAAIQKEEEARVALEEARAAKQEARKQADAIATSESQQRAEAMAIVQQTIDKGVSKTAGDSNKDSNKENKAEEKAEEESEDKEATITTKSGNTVKVELAPEPDADTEPIVENTTSSEVDSWAGRIDAYLAGSPLEGYGSVFAEAAAEYGVDPRISPAISCIESGKGAVCFLPHNAWGWGSSSWPDWESAIRDHVAGFAHIYGSTITLEGAQMYASNDIYAEWYSLVLSEMSSI